MYSRPGFTICSWTHDGFLDLRWVPGFTMGYWIHNGFLDSQWVPGFTMGSWIHSGFLDSRWVPGFTMGSWYCARLGTEIFGAAWIIRARHGNIWHGTDPPDPGMARHRASLIVATIAPNRWNCSHWTTKEDSKHMQFCFACFWSMEKIA